MRLNYNKIITTLVFLLSFFSLLSIPSLPKYHFKSVGYKVLKGTSGEKRLKSLRCDGFVKNDDKYNRLAIVSLFYQNSCYFKGAYAHGDFPVEKGFVTDENESTYYEAYKIYAPKHKASKFLASHHSIFYKFPKNENYSIYSFDGEKINKVAIIQASNIDNNK